MSVKLDMGDFDSFTEHLITIAVKDSPQILKKFLGLEGNKLRKKIQVRAKQEVKSKTGKYHDSWKRSKIYITRNNDGYGVLVYNAAPHSHLIEAGHRQATQAGEIFVKGKFILEKTVKDFEPKYYSDCDKLLDDFVKEIEK